MKGVQEVYVHLCSGIGRPIEDPVLSSVKLILGPGRSPNNVERAAASVLSEELAQVRKFADLLATDDFYEAWEKA